MWVWGWVDEFDVVMSCGKRESSPLCFWSLTIEIQNSSVAQNEDPPVWSSSSQQQQRMKSSGMSALKDSSTSKNNPMYQNSSKTPSHGVAKHMGKTHNKNNNSSNFSIHRDADRVVLLVNDFKSVVPSPGSAHQ